MDVGGAETMLMKIYRQINREKYQMDFALMSEGKSFYEDEIKLLGGRIFHITNKSTSLIKFFKQLRKIVAENNYKYVMRSGDNAACVIDLIAAKRGGAKTLIFNSTNSRTNSETNKEKFIHFLFKPLVKSVPTIKIGCSQNSNDFMFGKRSVSNGKSYVFHNALRIKDYCFNNQWRESIRRELNIPDDAFVIGNVGRFQRQKNHKFLVSVFREVLKRQQNSIMVLFGEGNLKNSILNKAKQYGISNRVILTGVRSDINKCLSALDVFAFPSLYEGLPNAVVEAEAAGLPCILSDTITKEVKFSDFVFFLPIGEQNVELWADTILSKGKKRNQNAAMDLEKAGYDIEKETAALVNLLFRN